MIKKRFFLLTVSYDGTNYCGFQLQENGITVQEILEKYLSRNNLFLTVNRLFLLVNLSHIFF